ncbi:S-locus glycoprotein [Corchorus capsularis]|uniref:S-locus glycoprotein n=1 Tax=Corchorus capsularis TaxID=210143 RepID=A0A1R3IQF1_COCAP|nr:S-locus glycoprotein [Corchorus capsularis]
MDKSFPYWKSSKPGSSNLFASDNMPSTIVSFLNISQNNTAEDFNDKRLVMNYTGNLQYWQLDNETNNWKLIWWEPRDKCSLFNYCGSFGTCNANNKLPCQCFPGFKPKFSEKWKAGDFSGGCSRNSTSSCGNDQFLRLRNMKVGYSGLSFEAKDEAYCREVCLKELQDLQDHQDGGYHLYIRVAHSDIESTDRNCETCGMHLVPYPLSTGPGCGDPMYSSFYCNNNTDQLSFMGNYNVIRVDPEARTFVIQIPSKEADSCDAIQSSRSTILQLNQSSPFNVTNWCTSDSSLIGNGENRCLCNRNFQWDGLALNCTQEFHLNGGQAADSSNRNRSLPLILGVTLAIRMGFLCVVVSIYMWKRKVVKKPKSQRKVAPHRYDTKRGVKELMELSHFEEKDGTCIDVPFFDFESILTATDNFSNENKLGKGRFWASLQGSKIPFYAPRAYHGLEEHNGANGDHVSDKHGDVMDVQEDVKVDPGLNASLEEHVVGGITCDRPLLGEAAQHRPHNQPLDRPSHAPPHGATGHNRPSHGASTGHNRPSHGASAHNRPMDLLVIPQGPMTRVRAKRFKEALLGFVRSHLGGLESIEEQLESIEVDITKNIPIDSKIFTLLEIDDH